jgi:transposase InsO family protein
MTLALGATSARRRAKRRDRTGLAGEHAGLQDRQVWRRLRCEGTDVARCTAERLMRKAGPRVVVRGYRRAHDASRCEGAMSLDRVNRQFKAQRPNQLWVSDSSVLQRAA